MSTTGQPISALPPVPTKVERTDLVELERAGIDTGNHATVGAILLEADSRDAQLFVTVANTTTTLGGIHLNGMVEKTDTAARTYTLPSGLGEPGDAITLLNSAGTGNITLSRGSGVALYVGGVNADVTIPPYSMITIVRSSTANRWIGP